MTSPHRLNKPEPWRRLGARAGEGLDSCDAAVMLLNAKALQSEWVRQRTKRANAPKAYVQAEKEPELFVIPVLLNGVRPQDVKNAGLKRLAKITQFMDRSAANRCLRASGGDRPIFHTNGDKRC